MNNKPQQNDQVWALVPVKQFSRAKARLTPWFRSNSQLDSMALVKAMLSDVLEALRCSSKVAGIAVVTSEQQVTDLLNPGEQIIRDDAAQGLNESLTMALDDLKQRGVSRSLILHGDIPLVTGGELDRCIGAYLQFCRDSSENAAALVTSLDGRGTNLLCTNPQSPLPLRFGIDSYQQHVQIAGRSGIPILTMGSPGIARDIDTEGDLNKLITCCANDDIVSATCRLLKRTRQYIRAVANE